MSTTKKPAAKKRGKYQEKLIIKGTFMDVINAVAKDTNNKRVNKAKV